MTTCDKCKFWGGDGRLGSIIRAKTQHRYCTRTQHGNETLPFMVDQEKAHEPAVVLDTLMENAELWTLPTFGRNAGEER